jgi:diadenosine tetraphosphate (Ap4A) HIT family hydrolase
MAIFLRVAEFVMHLHWGISGKWKNSQLFSAKLWGSRMFLSAF